jgi:hypothetical protein
MSNDPDSPPDRKPSTAASRQADRAAALRANLMRRKAQARGRRESAMDETQGNERPKPPTDA